MRVRAWILFPAALGFTIALIFVLAGQYAIGVGLGAATLTALAWQLRPLDHQGIAGGHVRNGARIAFLKVLGLFLAFVAVFVLMVEAALQHWGHYRMGTVAVLALGGLARMLLVELNRRGDEWLNWWQRAEGEVLVERQLEKLRVEGWFVYHNYKPAMRGNVDHIAVGPRGAFAIETKTGWYRSADAAQAVRSAMAVRDILGGGWVTGVVCIPGSQRPTLKGHAWLVGREHLVEWLRTQPGRPIAPHSMAALTSALVPG